MNMRVPKVESLLLNFPNLNINKALLIRSIAKSDNCDELKKLIARECPITHANINEFFSNPFTSSHWITTIMLQAIDETLSTFGVECLGSEYEYCNAGEAYATTLIYKRKSNNLFIGNWGSIVERGRLK